MLAELKTSLLSPRNYYILFMAIFDYMRGKFQLIQNLRTISKTTSEEEEEWLIFIKQFNTPQTSSQDFISWSLSAVSIFKVTIKVQTESLKIFSKWWKQFKTQSEGFSLDTISLKCVKTDFPIQEVNMKLKQEESKKPLKLFILTLDKQPIFGWESGQEETKLKDLNKKMILKCSSEKTSWEFLVWKVLTLKFIRNTFFQKCLNSSENAKMPCLRSIFWTVWSKVSHKSSISTLFPSCWTHVQKSAKKKLTWKLFSLLLWTDCQDTWLIIILT